MRVSLIPRWLGVIAVALFPAPSHAHEFWIDLSHGQVAPDTVITATLRVGQNLKGSSYPYLGDQFTDFVLVHEEAVWPVEGRDGDKPAASIRPVSEGLYIIAHRSVPFLTKYDDSETFAEFLKDEGLEPLLDVHKERGLPVTGFTERYRRHAKALFQVGAVASGQTDRLLGGLELELVAESNPFTEGLQELVLRLFQDGTPVAGRQVALFHGSQDVVSRSKYLTDDEGRITLPMSGPGEYLFNSVSLHPRDEDEVVWQSEWASLFFRIGPTRERDPASAKP